MRAFLLWTFLALTALVGPAAIAQSGPPPASTAPAVLADLQLIAEGPNQSVFQATLDPRAGGYSIIASDPSKPALVLLNTTRGGNVPAQSGYRGLVRTVDVEPTDSGLAVRFNVAAPAKAEVKPSGDRQLLVTVSRLSGAEALGSRPIGSADEPVVAASDLPMAVDPPPGEDGYELVQLKYADVSEVVGLLTSGTIKPNNTFIVREPGFGSPANTTTTFVSPQAQSAQEERPLGQPVDSGMAVDRRLNAIWIRGSPERIARIKAMIALIDVPVDSVILETQFVELTETGARNLGLDLANANGQLAVATLQTGSFVPYPLNPERQVPSTAIQAAIYAQIQKGHGRIVSKPRIAAQSGSSAKIITGDALPILTAITLSGVNGVSQQVQYVNVGVTLQIAPRVSSDGYVTSQIYCVVSSVTGYSQGYPTISQREAETTASVRDGETFVIGGLTQENDLSNRSRVPGAGDVPLLGRVFGLERSTRNRTELYIVITPHIVRHRRFEQLDGVPPGAPGRP